VALKIEAVLIETNNLTELAEFYRAGFELEAPETADADQLGFQIGDVYFGLEQVEDTTTPSVSMSLWFKVDDVQQTYDRLISLGAVAIDEPSEIDQEIIAKLHDPDGNTIGLLSDK